jgi:hypothetical protein
MRKLAVLGVLLIVLSPRLLAADSDVMNIGPVTLKLGMSHAAVTAQLPAGMRLGWQRDTLPGDVTATPTENGVRYTGRANVDGKTVPVHYDEENGEHGFIANASGEPFVFLVFERGKLTRATRMVGESNYSSANAPTLITAVAGVIDSWNMSGGEKAVVHASHLKHGSDGVDEIVFESGSRQLVILSTPGGTQVVENLGRGDVPSVTMSR